MAAVARVTTSPNARELSRKAVSVIGRAPRTVVCFRCAHQHEIILGRIDSDRACVRCRKSLKQGVIVQGAAKPKRKD